jgi:hypothetical protein
MLASGLSFADVQSNAACESNESWNFGPELSVRYQKRFKRYLSGHMSALEAFSHARRLRAEADDENVELFAEYWLSHAFFKAQIYPMAVQGFTQVMEKEISKPTVPVQAAALSCLLKISEKLQTRGLPASTGELLAAMPASDLRSRAAYRLNLSDKTSAASKWITPKSPYDSLMRGFEAMRKNQWKAAADSLDEYFMLPSRPANLKSQENHYRLLAGRAHYSLGSFKKAREYFSGINHSSNEFVEVLSELAWTQLRMREHNAAIGTALSLQTGWLMNTYSPEALMIMSMAFNETCHYPEALRAMDLFKKQYAPVSDWLTASKAKNDDYYSLALSSLKRVEGEVEKVPFRISGEWVRSPAFLNRQAEINEMIRQNDYMVQAEQKAQKAQKQMVMDLLLMITNLKKNIAKYRKENPDKDLLSNDIQYSLDELRAGLEDFDTLRRAAPAWKRLRKGNEDLASGRRKELVAEINQWIKTLNQQMLYQLADVVENFRFVEIEIYQGASMDMVFSHANPKFEKKLAEMKKNDGFRAGVWQWGALNTGDLQKQEIWEDELGGFKADLPNRCDKRKVANLGS